VSLAIPDPWVAPEQGTRPVCVVVPDTGLGEHPWFRSDDEDPRQKAATECACIVRTLGTTTVGPDGGLEPDPEGTGVRDDLTGALDRLSGHGTFIAGIVRQTAPSAQIVALPVMDSSGAVAEGVLYRTLAAVLAQHLEAEADEAERSFADHDGGLVDVVNLSMGFYHQDGELGDDHPMKQLLDRFADAGIIVVAAAGNDATRQPLYPAGWAVRRGAAPPPAPTETSGALNPDGATVALFSNAGEWVTTHAPGVNVVSTLPTTFRASERAVVSTPGEDGLTRATLDLGDLGKGFAVWSGTSFAAPHVAGWLAAKLAAAGRDGAGIRGGRSTRAARACSALGDVLRDGGRP
jgi:subtilisin family serine protease